MGRICTIATALVFLTASWVCAGNFNVQADAGMVRQPDQLHAPGTLVKAEFKSNIKTTADMELETDSLLPEPVSGKEGVKVKPAIAFKERSKGMAPPSKTMPKDSESKSLAAEAREESIDLEDDLEKQLVIQPPPARTEDKSDAATKAVEKKAAGQSVVSDKKADKKAAPQVKKMAPPDRGIFAIGAKPIQKVKPAAAHNPWNTAAGSYQHRPVYTAPAERMCNVTDCAPQTWNRANPKSYNQAYDSTAPAYMNSDPRRVPMPPASDRIVRDGVTIKLAPATAPPMGAYPEEDQSSGSEIINAAAEILGMPFAFLSSFF